MLINEITRKIIGAAYRVHAQLGPGLLESAYGTCMGIELKRAGLMFRREHPLPLIYAGKQRGRGYRVDFVVEDAVILELKSVKQLGPIHTAQMITYLKLSGCQVGLLMNFNTNNMQHGIKRVVLGFRDP